MVLDLDAKKKYESLPESVKEVARYLSLTKRGCTNKQLTHIINDDEFHPSCKQKYNAYDIASSLNQLANKKLFLFDSNDLPVLNFYVTEDALFGDNNHRILEYVHSGEENVDRLRIGIILNDRKLFEQGVEECLSHSTETVVKQLASRFCNVSMQQVNLEGMDLWLQQNLVAGKLLNLLDTGHLHFSEDTSIVRQIIDTNFHSWSWDQNDVEQVFVEYFILSADYERLKYIALRTPNASDNLCLYQHQLSIAAYHFWIGDFLPSESAFNKALKIYKGVIPYKKLSLSGIYGAMHILLLLHKDTDAALLKASAMLEGYQTRISHYLDVTYDHRDTTRYSNTHIIQSTSYFDLRHHHCYNLLSALIQHMSAIEQDDVIAVAASLFVHGPDNQTSLFSSIIAGLVLHWTRCTHSALQKLVQQYSKRCQQNMPNAHRFLNQLLETSDIGNVTSSPYNIDLMNLITMKQPWEKSLSNWEKLLANVIEKPYHAIQRKLLWFVDHIKPEVWAEVQKRKKNGQWGAPQRVIIDNILRHASLFSEEDREMLKFSIHYNNSWQLQNTLLALVGKQNVFESTGSRNPIALVPWRPVISVKRSDEGYALVLPTAPDTDEVSLEKVGPSTYMVKVLTDGLEGLASGFKGGTLHIPIEARERLSRVLEHMPHKIDLVTSLPPEEERQLINCQEISGNADIIVQLEPLDMGIEVRLLIQPLLSSADVSVPGEGSASHMIYIDGSRQRVRRDLQKEVANADDLIIKCPALSGLEVLGKMHWSAPDLSEALEVLQQLNQYRMGETIQLRWPRGRKITLDREFSGSDLRLNVKGGDSGWFEIEGHVQVDENIVLQMSQILELLNRSSSRFIELGHGKFIALTDSFAKKLRELSFISRTHDNQRMVHALAAPILDEIVQQAGETNLGEKWKAHINSLSKLKKHEPEIPHGFCGVLREYQLEGFKWMSRLTHMGFGACLADDMGLGKTVQTIALLLEKASHGPCLILAPASVCYNWLNECGKFAPSLQCITLHQGDRAENLRLADKMMVVICSYGLIYQVEELLLAKKWQIAVLDEAQAIKNAQTRRFNIIEKIQAIDRVALSGTPIENHTAEIWNLFQFLNPGFLGSRKYFHHKYANPIEAEANTAARDALKRMIHPFILRRTKDRVLTELPSKTEQTILIEPTAEELGFYRSLQKQSIERIAQQDNPGKQRFTILAEISKLRRACCDSRLLDDSIKIPSSKLLAFNSIVEELQENDHRALVFSQYVSYLRLVEQELQRHGINYQYLDGSTPPNQRQNRVEAFQSGEGRLFLISLRAGGIGLNLTSADYVIHMDPWWNPAVEDQASDRIHRIGQTRPITVYRLVMKHSIEEKILRLHKQKRDLALGLLDDAEASANLSKEDLLQLIYAE